MKRIFSMCMVVMILIASVTVNNVSAAPKNEFDEIMSSESFQEALKVIGQGQIEVLVCNPKK